MFREFFSFRKASQPDTRIGCAPSLWKCSGGEDEDRGAIVRPNKLREKLKAGLPTVGTHLHSSWPSIVEVVGHTEVFDYVEFVAQYAPFDLYSLDNFCRAVELSNMSAMIKVDQEPRRFLAQRSIGAGFQSILFADVRSVEDARECIRAVRPETPEANGCHGSAPRRATYMFQDGTSGYVDALNDIVIALMIEKQSAVDRLEEILSVPGIDMVQFGRADYCMSIGRPGEWNSSESWAVYKRVIETCFRMGIPPRAEPNTVDEAKFFLDLGVRHFCLGTDILILYDWLKESGQSLRKILSNQ
jgi:2-keto-3-deoxy-L-rhamnonate aldolase RhmA